MTDQEKIDAKLARSKAIQQEIAEHRAAIVRLIEEDSSLFGTTEADRNQILEETRELKKQGKEIEATKHYRARTGCGLREAHDVVQSLRCHT